MGRTPKKGGHIRQVVATMVTLTIWALPELKIVEEWSLVIWTPERSLGDRSRSHRPQLEIWNLKRKENCKHMWRQFHQNITICGPFHLHFTSSFLYESYFGSFYVIIVQFCAFCQQDIGRKASHKKGKIKMVRGSFL